jgi:uncharacterized protein (DUF3084 family)
MNESRIKELKTHQNLVAERNVLNNKIQSLQSSFDELIISYEEQSGMLSQVKQEKTSMEDNLAESIKIIEYYEKDVFERTQTIVAMEK